MLKDLRHHVARLQSKESLEITDQEQFKRPIYLHRRDPRAVQDDGAMDVDSKEAVEAEQERERQEAVRAERQRVREENQKLIAPSMATKKKPQAFKKKVEQVYRTDETPEDRKRNQLRYEEALPWFLEEMDNKNVWQGSYEAALSESHVQLMPVEDGKGFRVVPVEKWYRFRERNKFKHLDIEEAEARMGKKVKEPRWFMDSQKETERKKMVEREAQRTTGLFQRSGGRDEKPVTSENVELGGRPDEAPDADDIDFNVEEEFADDEENALFEGDDETQRMAEDRIKRDQLAANVFGMTDEQKVDEEAEREKNLKKIQKQLEKGTRKALLKREKNFDYESDSDENPYTEESESEDSDAEKTKEEERKKEEEAKSQDKSKPKGKEPEKPASGASTKGSNTPSGRKEKHSEPLRKMASTSLKRPGSPNLSEASGNESSRKKIKNRHGTAGSGTGTPKAGSPMPESAGLNKSRQSSFNGPLRGAAASGSDTEGTNSGRTKLKFTMRGSPNGTPRGSRAASPAVPSTKGSRAGSPGAAATPPPTGNFRRCSLLQWLRFC
jgi:transcription initiation factor TFIIF subunit alpha